MRFFPAQDIPETEKTPKWCGEVIDYCVYSFDHQRSKRIDKMNRLFSSYNGVINDSQTNFLTTTYGKKYRAQFVPMRIAMPKIKRLNGEFLVRSISKTIATINSEAKSKRLDNYHIQVGMMESAEEITKLREVAGVDVFNGMQIPDKNDPDVFEKMNTKTINELLMQIAIDYQFSHCDLKTKFASNFENVSLVSECYGKVEIKASDSEVSYREIDPRNAVFEEMDNDPFLLKSPYMGERRIMFMHDVIAEFPELSKEQRKSLDNVKANYMDHINGNSGARNYYKLLDGNLAVEVFTIEWKSVRPFYTMVIPDKNGNSPIKKHIEPEYYEKNKKEVDRNVARYNGKLETRYLVDIWEATRIGHEVDVRCRRKPYQVRSLSSPTETRYGYTAMLFGTVDGTRISLWELTENLSFLYDIIIYQINRELAKAKGKVVKYDRAFLPKGMEMKDILFGIANDGIYEMNSAQDGNKFGREVVVNGELKEIDLGISSLIQTLLPLKVEVKNTIDQITGINENREGNIAASSTATNANSSIQASMTITEPQFYYMNRYMENVLTLIAEHTKISWGILKSKKAEFIIGEAGVKFFKATKDLVNDDYGVYLTDSGKEMRARDMINRLAETSLNAKAIRLQDVLDVQMADSVIQAKVILQKGWEEVNKINQEAAQAQAEAQQRQLETQLNISKEDREDRQAHEERLVYITKGLEKEAETQKASNSLVAEQHKMEGQQSNDVADRMMGKKTKR
jgi:hypothetical protein